MIDIEKTVLVLLAAGKSNRFGDIGNKLDQMFLARPLGLHVAVALESMPFKKRVAIVDGCALDYSDHGFELRHNEDPDRDMASSVRMGVDCAQDCDADAVLIALADMPRVTASHIYRMFDAADAADAVVASSDGIDPKPPALFGKGRFEEILAIEGDKGARAMIRAGRHVVTSPSELIDVDTPEELDELRALLNDPDRTFTRAGAHRSD